MIEVFPNLFTGSELDVHSVPKEGWSVVHACKEPFHRQALGYKTNGAPKDHPEYLFAIRGNELCLNLIDVADPKWISPIVIEAGLTFIQQKLSAGDKVLVHCNQGQSRGPGLALLYIHRQGAAPKDFKEAFDGFKKIYPMFNPADGILGYILSKWDGPPGNVG